MVALAALITLKTSNQYFLQYLRQRIDNAFFKLSLPARVGYSKEIPQKWQGQFEIAFSKSVAFKYSNRNARETVYKPCQ